MANRERHLLTHLSNMEAKLRLMKEETAEYKKRLTIQKHKLFLDSLTQVHNRAALDERLDAYAEDTVAEYGGMTRMVNRNDETVSAVFVGGRPVFLDGAPTEVLGRERTGSFLRAGRPTPAPTTKGELADVG